MPRPVRFACLALLAWVCVHPARAGEDELFRQIKVDVFDQNWDAVLRGCDELLSRSPAGPAAPQAAFFRARALSRLPGRDTEAVEAYRRFLELHPGERLLVQEAWSGLFTLRCDKRRQATPECAAVLREGLDNPSAFVSTLAAIRAADTRDVSLHKRALPVLKRTLGNQADADIVNEILIAILKIDPRQVPQQPAPIAEVPRPAGATAAPSLIRMTVYNKVDRRYDLKVNLPVAFARMLVDSLEPDQKVELQEEARKQGVDLKNIFDAIRKSGSGRFLDIDTPESRVEIWIE